MIPVADICHPMQEIESWAMVLAWGDTPIASFRSLANTGNGHLTDMGYMSDAEQCHPPSADNASCPLHDLIS